PADAGTHRQGVRPSAAGHGGGLKPPGAVSHGLVRPAHEPAGRTTGRGDAAGGHRRVSGRAGGNAAGAGPSAFRGAWAWGAAGSLRSAAAGQLDGSWSVSAGSAAPGAASAVPAWSAGARYGVRRLPDAVPKPSGRGDAPATAGHGSVSGGAVAVSGVRSGGSAGGAGENRTTAGDGEHVWFGAQLAAVLVPLSQG